MKKLLLSSCCVFFLVGNIAYAQYYYRPYIDANENPGELNTDIEDPQSNGWTTILNVDTSAWTSSQKIPFDFDFDGNIVNSYIVASSGVLTFSTATIAIPTDTNTTLPSAEIPDSSICVWGINNSGANDIIRKKTFGRSPNRQHWVVFADFSSSQSPASENFTYWGIVLEETTNRIYLVDMRTLRTPISLTLGIQIDETTAYQVSGSPTISSNTNGIIRDASDNSYYEFINGEQLDYDFSVTENLTPPFPNLKDAPFSIKGSLESLGKEVVTSFDLNYSIDNGNVVTSNISNVSINPFDSYNFTHPTVWNPTISGQYSVKVWASNINGNIDENNSNDTLLTSLVMSDTIPNIIDRMLGFHNDTLIGNFRDRLNDPKDLDFHPDLSRKELWVINHDTEASGGSTVTYSNAGTISQTDVWKRDGNAWHFMSLPTGIAFSDNGNFANSPGVLDANHRSTTPPSPGDSPFTGPALWSSDPAIYAQPSGGNGSHYDMLHESPYSMGIAHEVDNAFWIFDGFTNDIVRYDFVDDHGPGNDDHSDAIVRRYPVPVKRIDLEIPSHLILDKETNWLYIVDGGNKRVLRLDITSGRTGGVPAFNQTEPLVEYSSMLGITWEVYIDSGLVEPSGIDIIGDRLLVSDHSTGDINVYNMSSPSKPAFLGKIETGSSGIYGIKVGPEGNIWYVNGTKNEVRKIEAVPTYINENKLVNEFSIYPNPSNGFITVLNEGGNSNVYQMQVVDVLGKTVYNENQISNVKKNFDFSNFNKGVYFITISINERERFTKRLIVTD